MGHLEKCARTDDMREVNRKVFRFGELIQYKFDKFIELYDYEECEKIFQEDEDEADLKHPGTGGFFNGKGHNLGKSVNEALDGLSAIMKRHNGKLPV